MINYRKYHAADRPALEEIHRRRGYTFPFPNLSGIDYVSLWTAEDDGVIVAAVIARKTVEVTALIDAEYANPAWRLEVLQTLQKHGERELKCKGFTDMHSFVKPAIFGFGRRLMRSLGWIRSGGGECFVRGL